MRSTYLSNRGNHRRNTSPVYRLLSRAPDFGAVSFCPECFGPKFNRMRAQSHYLSRMLRDALALSGLSFDDKDQQAMLQAVNQNLSRYEDVRKLHIPNDIAPPFYFSPIVPGMKVNRTRLPFRFSTPHVRRPANLEDAAFWPVTQLAQLLRTRQVTSVELTEMYLARLHRYNDKLNCVVTFLDEVALAVRETGRRRDQGR